MNSSSITDTSEAMSQLPSSDITKNDNVFPARDVLNSLVHNIKYILGNSIINQNTMLADTDDWDAVNPSICMFSGLGLNAPDADQLGATSGILITGQNFQFAITSNGMAYRVDQADWIYIGKNVPNNVDASQLVDFEHLSSYISNRLSNYTTNNTLNNQIASLSSQASSNSASASSTVSSLSSQISVSSSASDISDNSLVSEVTSLQKSLYSDYDSIVSNSSSAAYNADLIDDLADAVWGNTDSDSIQYSGVYGVNGLSSSISINASNISSNTSFDTSLSGSVSTEDKLLYNFNSLNASAISNNGSDINQLYSSASVNSVDANMDLDSDDVWVGTGNLDPNNNGSDKADMHPKVKDYVKSLAPYVSQAYLQNSDVATTSFVSSYSRSTVFSMSSAATSNLGLIKGDLYLSSGLQYELTANVDYQTDNISTNPAKQELEDVTGTLGFTEQDRFGDSEYQTNYEQNNAYTNNEDLVQFDYPQTNDDVSKQLANNYVDILFTPKADEKLGIVTISYDPTVKPPKFSNISLVAYNPIVSVSSTTSLLAMDTNDISSLSDEQKQDVSNRISDSLQNAEYMESVSQSASTAMSYASSVYSHASEIANSLGASYSNSNVQIEDNEGHYYSSVSSVPHRWPIKEFDSDKTGFLPVGIGSEYANAYNISQEASSLSSLNAQPAISFAPTASYADSCSQNNDHYVYIYPNYDNDKEEQAIDWCFEQITPDALEQCGNKAPNNDQVKNLVAGIIGVIITSEDTLKGNVADPQSPDTVQNWTNTNYLDWQFGGYSTDDILSYLNTTLMQSHSGEWQGWDTYLGLSYPAGMCGEWLSAHLNNPIDDGDCAVNADKVRSLLY